MFQQSGRSGVVPRPSAVGLNGMQILRWDADFALRSGTRPTWRDGFRTFSASANRSCVGVETRHSTEAERGHHAALPQVS